MKPKYLAVLAFVTTVGISSAAMADSYNFSFNGHGITASGVITTGAQTTTFSVPSDQITNITGTFSDSNVPGGVSGTITGLYTPVSYVADTLGSPSVAFTTGGLSYDDLLYPNGDSPLVCYTLIGGVPTITYPFSGGVFDIFGVAFNISGPGGYVAELWSNGDVGGGPIMYAAALADANGLVDNPNSGPDAPAPPGESGTLTTSPTPEPGSLVLLGTALLSGAGLARRRLRL